MSLQDEIMADFYNVFTDQIPLYVDNKHVGYFTSDQRMCAGYAYFFESVPRPVPSSDKWYVKPSLFGAAIPAATYCVSKGLKPSWMTDTQINAVTIDKMTANLKWPMIGALVLGIILAVKS